MCPTHHKTQAAVKAYPSGGKTSKTKLCVRWYHECKAPIYGYVTQSVMLINVAMSQRGGHAVARLVEATSRKVAVSIPDGVVGIFY